MIIAKLENKDVEELTLNFKNALGEVIQYNTTYDSYIVYKAVL